MNKTITLLLSLFIGSHLSAQYCMSGGPTQTIDSNVESVSLIGETGGINYTGCPGVPGVQLFTNQTTSISKGNSFTLSVQFGTCQGNYSGAGQVWIDYNQNSVFEQGETIGTWSGPIPTALSVFNFNVPLTAANGPTRMRVMQREAGSLPLDPCGSFSWGSVTDFIVSITDGTNCAGYEGDDMADAIIVGSFPYIDNHSNAICYSDQNPIYASPDVFYKVNVDPNNPFISASLCGSQFDTYITAMEPNGTVIIGNDDGTTCGPQSEILFNASGYSTVYIIVEGWGTQTGDYTLTINQNVAGLDENGKNLLNVFPNPVETNFSINNNVPGTISIINSQGMVQMTMEVSIAETIDVSQLDPGVYFLKFVTKNNFETIKFIKR